MNSRLFQNIVYALLGTIIAGLVTIWWQFQKIEKINALPASDWFTVTTISVPDFKVSEDPPINYERTVLQPFVGRWFVEVNEVGTDRGALLCQGHGEDSYQPSDKLPIPVTLSWFIGTHCPWRAGQFQLFVTWQLFRPGASAPVSVESTSNVFRVTE